MELYSLTHPETLGDAILDLALASEPAGDELKIAAKTLGSLALPTFCPRCFWIKMHARNRIPFSIFPSIFAVMDGYTKNVFTHYIKVHGRAPNFMGEMGTIVGDIEPPHHSTYRIIDKETGILLTGSPDAVFVMADGSYHIGDYKTSRFHAGKDSLYPMYEIQVNVYAMIGEQCGLSPVSGLSLIYADPRTSEAAFQAASIIDATGFNLGFDVRVLAVPLNPKLIRPLLLRARKIFDLKAAPPGRTSCQDCRYLNAMVDLVEGDTAANIAEKVVARLVR